MKDTKTNLLKVIKIYSMDDSITSTKTLYRVLNEGFESLDLKLMCEAVKAIPHVCYGRILEYANNIDDIDFINKMNAFRKADRLNIVKHYREEFYDENVVIEAFTEEEIEIG